MSEPPGHGAIVAGAIAAMILAAFTTFAGRRRNHGCRIAFRPHGHPTRTTAPDVDRNGGRRALLVVPLEWTAERFTVGWWALLAYPRLYAAWLLWLLSLRELRR